MDFKKGNWNPGAAADQNSDLLAQFDDKMSKRIVGDLKKQIPPGGFPSHKPVVSGGPTGGKKATKQDSDLMGSMAKRLQQLEQTCNYQKLEIKEKSQKLSELQQENETLKAVANPDYLKQMNDLKKEKEKFQQQCQEMVQFLADYGLVWVGKDGKQQGKFDDKSINQELAHKGPHYRNNLPSEIDTEVLSRRIEELNFIAEKQRIVKNKDGLHQFQKVNEVNIFFFKNGLMIKGFNFNPYYSKEAQSILSDILDGYFPYDLKQKYPEGVPLKPIDMTDETYTIQSGNPKFKAFEDIDKDANPVSKEEFLNQFPKNVIKNGNIIPIREELEKRFKEKPSDLEVNKLNNNEPITVKTQVSDNPNNYDPSQIVTLRIRNEDGSFTLLIKLLVSDTIKAVYPLIQPYLKKKFILRQNFPRKEFLGDETQTLKELGLAPSSALVVQVKS